MWSRVLNMVMKPSRAILHPLLNLGMIMKDSTNLFFMMLCIQNRKRCKRSRFDRLLMNSLEGLSVCLMCTCNEQLWMTGLLVWVTEKFSIRREKFQLKSRSIWSNSHFDFKNRMSNWHLQGSSIFHSAKILKWSKTIIKERKQLLKLLWCIRTLNMNIHTSLKD